MRPQDDATEEDAAGAGAQDAAPKGPPPRMDTGALMALAMLGELARASHAPRTLGELERALRVDADTLALGLACLAEEGFLAVACPVRRKPMLAAEVLAPAPGARFLFGVTPKAIAWAGRALRPVLPIASAVLEAELRAEARAATPRKGAA